MPGFVKLKSDSFLKLFLGRNSRAKRESQQHIVETLVLLRLTNASGCRKFTIYGGSNGKISARRPFFFMENRIDCFQ